MDPADLPPEYVARLRAVTDKRARTFITALLERGVLSTEELEELGYKHPPRAARDVRELGFPLITTRVTANDGRSIGAYAFADPAEVSGGVLAGRKAFPKSLKTAMIAAGGERCAACYEPYEERYLQIDHRVPFHVGRDDGTNDPRDFQLLCGSDNRAKSWGCEHCPNWTTRDVETCQTCYWSDPGDYQHVATRPERRAVVVWSGSEVASYDSAVERAGNPEALIDELKESLDDE